MSEFPYADEQVERWGLLTKGIEMCGWRGQLEILHNAGITVTFPEPRYYANRFGASSWVVVDRHEPPSEFFPAKFIGPNAEQYAREHADRLNREAQA